jgi:hypothetical protein
MKRGRFKFLGRNHLIEKSIDILAFLVKVLANIHGRLSPSRDERMTGRESSKRFDRVSNEESEIWRFGDLVI